MGLRHLDLANFHSLTYGVGKDLKSAVGLRPFIADVELLDTRDVGKDLKSAVGLRQELLGVRMNLGLVQLEKT